MICDEDTEQWRPVALSRYAADYEVSTWGRIRRRRASHQHPAGFVMKATPDRDGYLRVTLHSKGAKVWIAVHALVLVAFTGAAPDGCQACHGNGQSQDNHPLNLRWGTSQQNIAERERHGTTAKGEASGRSRFTTAQVLEMRARYANGARRRDIAAAFNAPIGGVKDVLYRRSWKHLP